VGTGVIDAAGQRDSRIWRSR